MRTLKSNGPVEPSSTGPLCFRRLATFYLQHAAQQPQQLAQSSQEQPPWQQAFAQQAMPQQSALAQHDAAAAVGAAEPLETEPVNNAAVAANAVIIFNMIQTPVNPPARLAGQNRNDQKEITENSNEAGAP